MLFSGKMETKIRLNNIQLYGYHGVDDNEKKNGQQFEIDIEAYKDLTTAIKTDNVDKTTDYSVLYDKVVNVFSTRRYNLIESLANQIASALTDDFCLSGCRVIIRKPDVPINGILDTVEVEIMHHV